MSRMAELIRLVQQAHRLDPVEAAFRACACLSESQRAALQRRFNAVFGDCVPPLTLAFNEPASAGDAE